MCDQQKTLVKENNPLYSILFLPPHFFKNAKKKKKGTYEKIKVLTPTMIPG